VRRTVALLFWQPGECCYLCGSWGRLCPNREHREFGTIGTARRRWWVPRWLASLVHWRRAVVPGAPARPPAGDER
jgi:hypothetical protein